MEAWNISQSEGGEGEGREWVRIDYSSLWFLKMQCFSDVSQIRVQGQERWSCLEKRMLSEGPKQTQIESCYTVVPSEWKLKGSQKMSNALPPSKVKIRVPMYGAL